MNCFLLAGSTKVVQLGGIKKLVTAQLVLHAL